MRDRTVYYYFACAAFLSAASPGLTSPARQKAEAPPSYAAIADLALAARISAIVRIDAAVRLKGEDAQGLVPGRARFYLRGTVETLLAGRGGLPAQVEWIADVPLDASNHPPKLKRARVLLLARPTQDRPGTLQLVARDAMLPWSAEAEARVRAILTEAASATAPPAITGIGHAFHVAGTIPGEGETQVFLRTGDARPVSLSVVRRPGEAPRWSVSLGELVDDAASAPKPDTLLWYRLACALPAALPDVAVADQSPEDAGQARADYRFVVESLGPCGRAPADPPADQSSR